MFAALVLACMTEEAVSCQPLLNIREQFETYEQCMVNAEAAAQMFRERAGVPFVSPLCIQTFYGEPV